MLELRPICEHCGVALPPESLEAMICSFECTFCRCCVERVLANVCPNCGGGFCPRPVRPRQAWKSRNTLDRYPAATSPRHRPVDPATLEEFAGPIRALRPEDR
jgi:uncharacterized protein